MGFNFNRKKFGYGNNALLGKDVLRGSASLDFPSMATNTSQTLTITVTGAAVGDDVMLSRTGTPVNDALFYHAWVSAANTVSVRARNNTTGTIDPAAETFRVIVFKAF
jgi:hypothetical protein